MSLSTAPACASAMAQEAALRCLPLPTILWIELTSRCPFDCVFCSRKLLRGAGLHMDFELYRGLIASLSQPEIIRLNYSGESIHYPHLIEAIGLAAGTGAAVELVTALAALPESKIEALAMAGLSQLTVSLHTLSAAQFRQIYRFNELDALRLRLERLVALSARAPRRLHIDLAFVAMQRNLNQLPAVVDYAAQLGLSKVAVHPVIRRDPIEERFEAELSDGRLRPEFAATIAEMVHRLRQQHPQLAIELSTPEVAGQCPDATAIDGSPRYFPGELPSGAQIADCDQDPWQTVHVLADGRVVSCEQRDQIFLGDLHTETLEQIWQGEKYLAFRQRYLLGEDPHCRQCPYKRVHRPQPAPRQVLPGRSGMSALLTGWHPGDGTGLVWSKPRALLRVSAEAGERIALRLLLPWAAGGNQIQLRTGVEAPVVGRNSGTRDLEMMLELRAPHSGTVTIELQVAHRFRPALRDGGADLRELGVGLLSLRVGQG